MIDEPARGSGDGVRRTLFSIVTVCMNAEETIERCVRSVVSQLTGAADSDFDFEYLVIDGGSRDETVRNVRSCGRGIGERLRVVSEPDDGIYDAMNKALKMARGDYIAYVNADDWLEDGALATVASAVDAAGERPEAAPDVIAGAMCVHGLDGSSRLLTPEPEQVTRRYPSHMPAGHQAMFVRTQMLLSANGFDTRFRIAADYDLALRLIRAGATWTFVPNTLVNFCVGGASYPILPTAREYRRVRLANGFPALRAWALFVRNVVGSLLARGLNHSPRGR
jgi:glycosyltransferase involved in cell wall biosynthesis